MEVKKGDRKKITERLQIDGADSENTQNIRSSLNQHHQHKAPTQAVALLLLPPPITPTALHCRSPTFATGVWSRIACAGIRYITKYSPQCSHSSTSPFALPFLPPTSSPLSFNKSAALNTGPLAKCAGSTVTTQVSSA